MIAYIGLGSNLDDPVAQVDAGARALAALPDTIVRRCSSLYRSAPLGFTGQPDFVNAVCALDTRMPAERLMRALLAIETDRGRVRDRPGGPRVLDLDLLVYEGLRCDAPGLSVPHPRLHERAFVLYPLYEIAPHLVIPGHGPVAQLLQACAGQDIERLAQPWLAPAGPEQDKRS